MKQILNLLVRDCRAYRAAVDAIFADEVANPSDWRRCLLDIQICVTRLQLDRLTILVEADGIEALPVCTSSPTAPKSDVKRELELRQRIKHRLEASPVWSQFNTQNPMAELFGLRSLKDYIQNFELHLPDVYEETFRIEQLAQLFIVVPSSTILIFLFVAVQHVGQNHIPFLQPALDWASDEDFWG